jgi:hypothetical protein
MAPSRFQHLVINFIGLYGLCRKDNFHYIQGKNVFFYWNIFIHEE